MARVSDTRPRVICDVVSTSLAVVRLDRELPMPSRAHDGDAGVDLYSALDVADRVYVLETGQVVHQADAAALAQQTELLFARLGVQ